MAIGSARSGSIRQAACASRSTWSRRALPRALRSSVVAGGRGQILGGWGVKSGGFVAEGWASDGRTFFFVGVDAQGANGRVYTWRRGSRSASGVWRLSISRRTGTSRCGQRADGTPWSSMARCTTIVSCVRSSNERVHTFAGTLIQKSSSPRSSIGPLSQPSGDSWGCSPSQYGTTSVGSSH